MRAFRDQNCHQDALDANILYRLIRDGSPNCLHAAARWGVILFMPFRRLIFFGATVLTQLIAQTPPKEFEVASIKPAAPDSKYVGAYLIAPGGRFMGINITVGRLIQQAYDVRDFQVTGAPSWIDSERYDIEGKAEGWSTPAQLQPLVQALLAERFKLEIHRDTREMPIYALLVGKNGPKLKESTSGGGPAIGGSKGRINAHQVTLAMFAGRLGQVLGRPVVDKTGLKGEYDFVLEWTPDEVSDPSGPSIFTALQEQFGLRLEGQKGAVEILVVDRVVRPSQN